MTKAYVKAGPGRLYYLIIPHFAKGFNHHFSIIIQTDYDFPCLARSLGANVADNQIEEAQQYIDSHLGKVFDASDYFE